MGRRTQPAHGCGSGVCAALTSSPLKGLRSPAGALGAGAVLASPDLGVEGSNVEKHTGLLEGQGPLLGRDPRERVVPAGVAQAGRGPMARSRMAQKWGAGRGGGLGPRAPHASQPLPVEEQPQAPGRGDEARVQEAELLVVGGEQLQARLAPAGRPHGLRAGPAGPTVGPAPRRTPPGAPSDTAAPREHWVTLGCCGLCVPPQEAEEGMGGSAGAREPGGVPGEGRGMERPLPKGWLRPAGLAVPVSRRSSERRVRPHAAAHVRPSPTEPHLRTARGRSRAGHPPAAGPPAP